MLSTSGQVLSLIFYFTFVSCMGADIEGVIERTSDWCGNPVDSGSCQDNCTKWYYIVQAYTDTQNSTFVVSPKNLTEEGCMCATGVGYSSSSDVYSPIPIIFANNATALLEATVNRTIVITDASCGDIYAVTAGSVLNVFPPGPPGSVSMDVFAVSIVLIAFVLIVGVCLFATFSKGDRKAAYVNLDA
eukprot:m.182684 g.182684  ORF g.182684 m.182684 type:complete len:188 (-) comp32127_c0_seq1:470-1033(-)